MQDLIGKKFGRLVVIKQVGKNKQGNYCWLCRCCCNNKNEFIVSGGNLKSNHTQSCGCSRIKHNHAQRNQNNRTYKAWYHMKERCLNINSKKYKDYGGRGIIVCERWKSSFKNFLEDMGEVPEGLQLDRIDNNKGYYKENCRWTTSKEQNRNKRNNYLITHNKRTQCLMEWSEETIIPYDTLRNRFRLGWSIEEALITPIKKRRKNARQ